MKAVFETFTAMSSIFGSFGVISNLIICILYLRNRELLDAPNIFFFNIALAGFIYSTVALPMLVWSNSQGQWLFGAAGCTGYAFVTALFGLGSIMHLAGTSYERYVAIKHFVNSGDGTPFDRKKALRLSLLLWCYSFFWSLMPVLGWSSYVEEGVGTSCAVNWTSSETSDVSFALCLLLTCFVLPVTVIVYCYYKCYKALSHFAEYAMENWGESERVTQELLEAERKLAWESFVMTTGFLVAWTPYAVASTVAMINASLVSKVAVSIPAYIAKASACYNPFINLYLNKELRRKLAILFCGLNQAVHPHPNVPV